MKHGFNPGNIGNFDTKKKITIVSTYWNSEFIDIIEKECEKTLKENGINNIEKIKVPGSLELPFGALKGFEKGADIIIVIGVIIRGDTNHFDVICDGVNHGIMKLQIEIKKPIIFGVLTCDNIKQVEERLNKGKEFALSAIQMIKIL